MNLKPTYEQLENRPKELEATAGNRTATEVDSLMKAPDQADADLAHFIKSLELVSQALLKSTDVDCVIEDVLEAVFSIFKCDRIWLFYPCDPEASTFRVFAEKNKREYPGAFTSGQELPITPEAAQTIRISLDSGSPIAFDPASGNELDDIAINFSVLSQMIMAVHPKFGKPWMFGMHQCSHARVWTKYDQKLFAEISCRVVESISNLILLRELKQSEQKYRNLLENLPQKIFLKDENSVYLACNAHYARDLSINPEDIVGKTDYDFFPKELADKYRADDKAIMASGQVVELEENYLRDGKELIVKTVKMPHRDHQGNIVGIQGIFWDITARKKMEERLQQAYKMEAIGTLAGGIAHDFNNILSIIIGNTELAIDDVPAWNPTRSNLNEIKTAGLRAKDLVRQLLSFSRKSKQQRKPLNIIPIITESMQLLRASIPSTVEIRTSISQAVGPTKADPTQLQQVIINLCTNAAHAMEHGGGILEVALDPIDLDEESTYMFNKIAPGRYIKLTVSDTGKGIDPQIQDKIFDPYFTTKGPGKGSGMGLAIVHGIVMNHNGTISVYSDPGNGTVIKVLFPVCEDEHRREIAGPDELPTGDESILLIDDEEPIVKMTGQMLKRLGYHVESSKNPAEALDLFQSKPQHFDLILSDMTMPQMTGLQLAEKLLDIRQDVPVIICSGYSALIDEAGAKALGIAAIIMKPIVKQEIAKTIRKVLDHAHSS